MSEPILSIRDLKVNYGGIEAVKGISFDVEEGSIVTLIGANGAGKSSTLRSIAGLVRPAGGKIVFRGDDITGYDTNVIVRKGITLVPEGRRIFPDLTVQENLRVGAYLRSDDISGDIQWVFDLFPRLRERSWQAGGTLSGGEQQMLAVARALMSKPKLIMMDEPSLGLAPLVVRGILNALMEGKDLSRETAETFMEDLTDGIMDERQMAGILTALFAKGPSADEIAGCAGVLSRKKRRFPRTGDDLLDIVGTGGDGKGSFNVSSLSGLIAASCGANPNATFTSVQTSRPKQNIRFGFMRSPITPFRNFESP